MAAHESQPDASDSGKPRTLVLPAQVRERIARHACASFPKECCGVLLGRVNGVTGVCESVVPGENIRDDDPTRAYQLDWRTLLDCVKRTRDSDEQIVGFYHSHPCGDAYPSERDRREAWRGVSYVIVPVQAGGGDPVVESLRSWRIDESGGLFSEETIRVVGASGSGLNFED